MHAATEPTRRPVTLPLKIFSWVVVGLCCAVPALRLAASAADAPIELPPLIVSDSKNARPWRYVAAPDLEVLSRCDDERTEDLVVRNIRLNQLLTTILPQELQFRTAAPRMIVLVDGAAAPSLSQGLVANLDGPGGTSVRRASSRNVRVLPNLELQDIDLMAVFAILDGRRGFNADRIAFTSEHVRIILERRAPPLPAWFIEGFMRLFEDMSFQDSGVRLPDFNWVAWAEQRRLVVDVDAPRRIMPLEDFFALNPANAGSNLERWRAEAALLIRWALDGDSPERRQAFWRFVDAAAVQGESEALLRSCFQFGYADLRDRLSDYLPVAVKTPLVVTAGKLPPLPKLRLRDATPAEIGRLKGEWERLEVGFVQPRHPQYTGQYIELARRTLADAREHAPNDPGVLTASGLLELDVQRSEPARPFLEAAAAAGPVRPRVYIELARFRLADALKAPTGEDGRISLGQAQIVLEPLQKASAERPPIGEVYSLTAEVWARSGAQLRPEQLRMLEDGLQRFPKALRLTFYLATLEAVHGRFDLAIRLAEQGVAKSTTEGARAQFANLRDSLVRARKAMQPGEAPVAAPP